MEYKVKKHIKFELMDGGIAYIKPGDIAGVKSGCDDNALAQLIVKGLSSYQIRVKGHPTEVIAHIEKFTEKK